GADRKRLGVRAAADRRAREPEGAALLIDGQGRAVRRERWRVNVVSVRDRLAPAARRGRHLPELHEIGLDARDACIGPQVVRDLVLRAAEERMTRKRHVGLVAGDELLELAGRVDLPELKV